MTRRANRPDSTALTVGTSPRMTRPDGLPFADLRSSLTCSIWRIRPGGAVEQHPAGAGQEHAAAVADEQLDAKLVLEQLDVPAQRGLGGAQPVRRLAEAPELGHGAEGPQLFEIHRMPRCSSSGIIRGFGKSVQLDQCSHDMRVNGVAGRDGPRAMLLVMEERSTPGIPNP